MFSKKYQPKRAIQETSRRFAIGVKSALAMMVAGVLGGVMILSAIMPMARADNHDQDNHDQEAPRIVSISARAESACSGLISFGYVTDPEDIPVQVFWKINDAEWEAIDALPPARSVNVTPGDTVIIRVVIPNSDPTLDPIQVEESDPVTAHDCDASPTPDPTSTATASPTATATPDPTPAPTDTPTVTPTTSTTATPSETPSTTPDASPSNTDEKNGLANTGV